MTTLKSSNAHLNQRSQFLSSISSDPIVPAVPESWYATHMKSSSKNTRGTVSSTFSYYSKAAHVGFSRGGTRMSGCFYLRMSATGCPVFVQKSPRKRYPPLTVGGLTDRLQ